MRRIIMAFLVIAAALSAAACGEGVTMEEMYIPGSLGDIYCVLKTPEGAGEYPLVILSHGFGANHMTLGDYADAYAARGFAALTFDFCGGGYASRSGGKVTEMSVKTEEEDLLRLIDWAQTQGRFTEIHLFGESQGGFVSACAAARRADVVMSLTLLYPAFVLQDDARRLCEAKGGFPETYAVMGVTIGRVYGEDAVSFDVYDVIPAYRGDVLIMHGDSDGIVPIRYSERARDAYEHSELVVFEGQGHGFAPAQRRAAIERAVSFAQAHIKTQE